MKKLGFEFKSVHVPSVVRASKLREASAQGIFMEEEPEVAYHPPASGGREPRAPPDFKGPCETLNF